VARALGALQDILRCIFSNLASSRFPEAEADRGLEPTLDELVEHADDAVERADIEVLEQDATDEINVAVGTDREVRAVGRVVPLQEKPVQLLVMRRRIRHEIHLVTQRALMQIEVDRRRVPPLASEAHVPARYRGVVLDRLHPFLASHRSLEVRGDYVVLRAPHLRIEWPIG